MSEKSYVLVVDDEPRNQRIVAEMLDGIAEFKLASSGEEAMALAEESPPELILLDIMMPGIDGYEVCRRIRANPKFLLTKVILVSGKAMIEERLKGYEVGADDYMTKPFVTEELMAKANVFLRMARLEKELNALNQNLDNEVKLRTAQLVRAEAELVNTAKMSALGEMAGGIAHEINSPLAAIGLLAEQMQEIINDDPIDKVMLNEMLNSSVKTVMRIGTIINGLRTFSRDGAKDELAPVSLKQILSDTLTLCYEKMKQNGVTFDNLFENDELLIKGRAVQLSQVFLNLISNSCDAIAGLDDRWVEVSAEVKPDKIRIFITDSGAGIPKEVSQKIFQPFFTTKEIGKGTGLGLSISKGIVDAHGGSIELNPENENTQFIIEFPRAGI